MVQVLLASPDRCNSKPYLRAHWMALMGLLIGLRADAPPSSTNSARPTTSFMVFRGKHAEIAGLTVPPLTMPCPLLVAQLPSAARQSSHQRRASSVGACHARRLLHRTSHLSHPRRSARIDSKPTLPNPRPSARTAQPQHRQSSAPPYVCTQELRRFPPRRVPAAVQNGSRSSAASGALQHASCVGATLLRTKPDTVPGEQRSARSVARHGNS